MNVDKEDHIVAKETIAHDLGVPALILDEQGTIVDVNDAARSLFDLESSASPRFSSAKDHPAVVSSDASKDPKTSSIVGKLVWDVLQYDDEDDDFLNDSMTSTNDGGRDSVVVVVSEDEAFASDASGSDDDDDDEEFKLEKTGRGAPTKLAEQGLRRPTQYESLFRGWMSPRAAEASRSLVEQRLRSGARRRRAIAATHKSERTEFVVHSVRLRKSNGTQGFVLICEDVTPLFELDVQKRLLSQICHEARNKLAPAAHVLESLLGIADDVKAAATTTNRTLEDDLRGMRDDIVLSLGLLQETETLITTRLQLHRVLSGTYDTEKNTQVVDVYELMRERVTISGTLAVRGVTVKVQVQQTSSSSPIMLNDDDDDGIQNVDARLDTYLFKHLANNLLSNSLKHTTRGEVVLTFYGETNDHLVFGVRDDGHGVATHVAERLFVEEVTTGAERGVGLGLVSSRQFARAVGGDLWLHSTKVCTPTDPNGGSDFRFQLPGRVVVSSNYSPPKSKPRELETTVLSEEEDESTEFTLAQSPFHTTDVYLVEDSDLIRRTMIGKLTKLTTTWACHWRFHEFATVEAIIEVLPSVTRRTNVIVFVDENLDSAGGYITGSDLIKQLTGIPNFYGTMFSVSGDPFISQKHIDMGAHLALGKPLPANTKLAHIILDCLAKRSSPDASSSSSSSSSSETDDDQAIWTPE